MGAVSIGEASHGRRVAEPTAVLACFPPPPVLAPRASLQEHVGLLGINTVFKARHRARQAPPPPTLPRGMLRRLPNAPAYVRRRCLPGSVFWRFVVRLTR